MPSILWESVGCLVKYTHSSRPLGPKASPRCCHRELNGFAAVGGFRPRRRAWRDLRVELVHALGQRLCVGRAVLRQILWICKSYLEDVNS